MPRPGARSAVLEGSGEPSRWPRWRRAGGLEGGVHGHGSPGVHPATPGQKTKSPCAASLSVPPQRPHDSPQTQPLQPQSRTHVRRLAGVTAITSHRLETWLYKLPFPCIKKNLETHGFSISRRISTPPSPRREATLLPPASPGRPSCSHPFTGQALTEPGVSSAVFTQFLPHFSKVTVRSTTGWRHASVSPRGHRVGQRGGTHTPRAMRQAEPSSVSTKCILGNPPEDPRGALSPDLGAVTSIFGKNLTGLRIEDKMKILSLVHTLGVNRRRPPKPLNCVGEMNILY